MEKIRECLGVGVRRAVEVNKIIVNAVRKTTLETGGKILKTTLETGGKILKTTLETSVVFSCKRIAI
jgi:hypothetical protein